MSVSKAIEVPGLLRAHLRVLKQGPQEAKAPAATDTTLSLLRNLFLNDYLLTRPLED
ncbi:MAG TPA: hypothetical protein GXX50_12705 [Firmicutes bacterium]|nr:hypothetical protein [Bacillota bacterium]HHV58599.1 hypothetical protein [Bacillota bacterium]